MTTQTTTKTARAVKRPVTHITRAKTLDAAQFDRALTAVRKREHGVRDEVLLRLSFFCGLRAQEIAGLQWERHILDANSKVGTDVLVTSDIGKGSGRIVERKIPLDPQLRDALNRLRRQRPDDLFVIYSLSAPRAFRDGRVNRADEGGVAPNTLVQYFRRLYAEYGFNGCTSHSGRRTFITNLGRNCGKFDSSLKDVAELAGHRDINTTAGYIEPSKRARGLVSSVFA